MAIVVPARRSAMHWLSSLAAGPRPRRTARGAVREAFAAAADWETILLHRARELVPGSQLDTSKNAMTAAFPVGFGRG
jgi:hypothetical protein